MRQAIEAVKEGRCGAPTAAKEFGVPQTTLERRVKTCSAEKLPLGPRSTVFSAAQEEELVRHILDFEKQLHGLTLTDVRRLVFQFASVNNIPNLSMWQSS